MPRSRGQAPLNTVHDRTGVDRSHRRYHHRLLDPRQSAARFQRLDIVDRSPPPLPTSSRFQTILYQMQGHVAPAESGQQEVQRYMKVGNAPDLRTDDTEHPGLPACITQHELCMAFQVISDDRPLKARKGACQCRSMRGDPAFSRCGEARSVRSGAGSSRKYLSSRHIVSMLYRSTDRLCRSGAP